MLLPVWLIHACGIPPDRTGLFMRPLRVGMMCGYPLMDCLADRSGIRGLSGCGALCTCTCIGTLLLVVALFLRDAGTGTVGIPAMSADYASVARPDIPVATTALNIVQWIGDPTLTTLCATFLRWRLSAATQAVSGVFTATSGLPCVFYVLLVVATLRLPLALP